MRVAVAAVNGDGGLRVVVGAVAETPQHFPDAVRGRRAEEIGRGYAERIEPIDDARGSAAYRRRVIAVEVRRAIEAVGSRPARGRRGGLDPRVTGELRYSVEVERRGCSTRRSSARRTRTRA